MSSRKRPITDFITGIFTVFSFHLFSFILMGLLMGLLSTLLVQIQGVIGIIFGGYFFLIGITQLIYVVPYCLYLKRNHKYDLMKGVIVGAVITLLLNGGCWLMILNIH